MGGSAGRCILLFDSIHHVLAAEQVLLQRGVWHDMVPTPRDVHSDCGMVIEFREDDLAIVSDLILDLDRKPREVYRSTEHGYLLIDRRN
jgi:hypothetical protein